MHLWAEQGRVDDTKRLDKFHELIWRPFGVCWRRVSRYRATTRWAEEKKKQKLVEADHKNSFWG